MKHHVDVDIVDVRVALSRQRVADIARAVLRAERAPNARLSITFVSTRRIAALNERHLRHRGPTDVISFSFAPDATDGPLIGDIYIAPEIARRNARVHRAPVREEIARLVVHGVLHVLGFDHPEGRGRASSPMWRRQEALVAELMPVTAATRRRKHLTRSAA